MHHPTLNHRQELLATRTRRIDALTADLTTRRREAWDEHLSQVGRMWSAGELDFDDLQSIAMFCRLHHGPGYRQLWNKHIPHDPSTLKAKSETAARMRPSHGGYWYGTLPLRHPYPPDGVDVVYMLLGLGGVLLYVGSTGVFASRVKAHLRVHRQEFTAWIAVPFLDRQVAYGAEREFLRHVHPALNRLFPI